MPESEGGGSGSAASSSTGSGGGGGTISSSGSDGNKNVNHVRFARTTGSFPILQLDESTQSGGSEPDLARSAGNADANSLDVHRTTPTRRVGDLMRTRGRGRPRSISSSGRSPVKNRLMSAAEKILREKRGRGSGDSEEQLDSSQDEEQARALRDARAEIARLQWDLTVMRTSKTDPNKAMVILQEEVAQERRKRAEAEALMGRVESLKDQVRQYNRRKREFENSERIIEGLQADLRAAREAKVVAEEDAARARALADEKVLEMEWQSELLKEKILELKEVKLRNDGLEKAVAALTSKYKKKSKAHKETAAELAAKVRAHKKTAKKLKVRLTQTVQERDTHREAVNKHVSLHESTVLELSTSHTEELETVKNEYEETIGDLEARLSAATRERDRLTVHRDRLYGQLDEHRERVESVEDFHAEANRENETLRAEIAALREQHEVDLAALRRESEGRVGRVSSSLQLHQAGLEAERDSHKDRAGELESDLSAARHRVTSLETKVAGLESKIEADKAFLDNARRRIPELESSLGLARTQVTTLEERLDEQRDLLAEETQAHAEDVERLESRMEAVNSELVMLKFKYMRAKSQLDKSGASTTRKLRR